MKHRKRLAGVALGAIAALALPLAGSASAGGTGWTTTPITDGLVAPLGLAVKGDGGLLVAESFGAGKLTAIKNGAKKTIVQTGSPDLAISGVDTKGPGTTTFTVSGVDAYGKPVAVLKVISATGQVSKLADLGAFEAKNNPDQIRSYGFQGLSPSCADTVPEEVGGGYPYPGQIDSNPYAVAILSNGDRVVADAGANALLRVKPSGAVSTLAVMPTRPVTVTKAIQESLGFDKCTIGAKYNFEFVPTDVEVGPDGRLYVTSLPGGPEDASLGPRGAVFKVNPSSGAVSFVATGFLGATDLAVTPTGKIFVTELFGNRISQVVNGGAQKVVDVNQPAAIEFSCGKLYATTDAFGNGAVVKISPQAPV